MRLIFYSSLGDEAMIYDIILSKKNDKYIARAREWPEVEVIENSRTELGD